MNNSVKMLFLLIIFNFIEEMTSAVPQPPLSGKEMTTGDALSSDYPFHVSIQKLVYSLPFFKIYKFECAGSIMSEYLVMTVAACAISFDDINDRLVVGQDTIYSMFSSPDEENIFKGESRGHTDKLPFLAGDIGFIRVYKFIFNENVQKVDLFKSNLGNNTNDFVAMIVGHGIDKYFSPIMNYFMPCHFKYEFIDLHNGAKCMGADEYSTQYMCVYRFEGSSANLNYDCIGVPGTPVISKLDKFYLIAILFSENHQCWSETSAIRLFTYKSLIEEQIQDAAKRYESSPK